MDSVTGEWLQFIFNNGMAVAVAWWCVAKIIPAKDKAHNDERIAWQKAMEEMVREHRDERIEWRKSMDGRTEKYENLLTSMHEQLARIGGPRP